MKSSLAVKVFGADLNVLESQGKTWGVFHDTTLIPSLTWGQFLTQLGNLGGNFHQYKSFEIRCQAPASAQSAAKLPAYSFIEPRFTPELGLFEIDYPSDYHPPHNVCRGEQFLAGVYQSIRNSPYRDKILLVITFDEHGGCYDHVPPPTGAVAPQPGPVSRDGQFDFSRYGVRVPAIVISSYVQPGTVFRASPNEAPYDHTSILATLRDWLSLDSDVKNPFLPSPRVKGAPTLDRVLALNEQNKNTNWPDISAQCTIGDDDKSLQTPLNDVQKSLIAIAIRQNDDHPTNPAVVAAAARQAKLLKTYAGAMNCLHPDAPPPPKP